MHVYYYCCFYYFQSQLPQRRQPQCQVSNLKTHLKLALDVILIKIVAVCHIVNIIKEGFKGNLCDVLICISSSPFSFVQKHTNG